MINFIKKLFKNKHKDEFIEADDAIKLVVQSIELEYKNLISELNRKIKSAISCGHNTLEISYRLGGNSDIVHEFNKHHTRVIIFLQSKGYSVETENAGSVSSSPVFIIKWGDKKSLFNKQMKDIIES